MESNNETPTHRTVNGEQIPLTEQEKENIQAKWESYSPTIPRNERIALMNAYMQSLVEGGELSQEGLNSFLEDTFIMSQTFLSGSTSLIQWVETTGSYSLSGFKNHPEYRGENEGTLLNPVYTRANNLLLILQQ